MIRLVSYFDCELCHHSDEMYFGAWRNPYFETEVGIAFAGYCFEALTIIAHITRCLEEIVASEGDEPKPDPRNWAVHLRRHPRRRRVQAWRSPAGAYLQIVESRRDGDQVRYEELQQSGQLERLLRSGARFASKALVLSAIADDTCTTAAFSVQGQTIIDVALHFRATHPPNADFMRVSEPSSRTKC